MKTLEKDAMINKKKNVTHNASQRAEDLNVFYELTKSQKNYLPIKRLIDVILSLGSIIVFAPIIAGIAIAIKLDSPGPILFKQKRIGKNKKIFEIYKFRTMYTNTPQDTPTHMLTNPEVFITRAGKFLRKTSLDEVPQIFNILKGDMSIIGPRPALWNQDDLILERDKYGANNISPGLTGWAQINGRDELEIPVKACLDGEYVKKMGFVMDTKCFFGTIGSVLNSEGIVEGGISKFVKESKGTNASVLTEDIKGKKILFFAPAFFGYENLIQKKIIEMGAECDMYDVRSVTSARDRALLKIAPKLFASQSKKYYEKIFLENQNKDYDYILIVKCDMTSSHILKKMRKNYPNAKLCLYLWDSVKNIPGVTEKFKYFDALHSFDPDDCRKYPVLKFRPLFYADEFRTPLYKEKNYRYDISFLGTIHSDRYKVIKQVQKIVQSYHLSSYWFCYLQSSFIYKFYKLVKKELADTVESDFSYEKMSSKEIADIVEQTKIILDIQHPKQTGLTMRTIEMIGMNKKLITTNAHIKNYEFYNSNNISVIDRNHVEIDIKFFDSDYEPLLPGIYEKYSLETWIKEVLS